MRQTLRAMALAAVTISYIQFTGLPAAAETLYARGKYLVETIAACGNCHTPMGPKGPIMARALSGGPPLVEAGFKAFATNITPDKETGIGKWTDAQIIRAIREGVRPDGSIIRPPMPFELYRKLSDRDVKAMVVYLRRVKPIRARSPKSEYKIPLPKSYGPPVGRVAEVPRTDKVAYGAYLAGPVGHCMACHSPIVRGRIVWERVGAGGEKFHGPWGVSVSRNITPHKTDGLGAWSDAEIKRAITKGITKDGSKLLPPMPYHSYAGMTPADLDALVAYLRSLKPLVTN
ncbi:MAG: cytochrome c [Alphaproteobacteria bacterium]|nr:cytochrome c [Alphaproteobacteria bacterium]